MANSKIGQGERTAVTTSSMPIAVAVVAQAWNEPQASGTRPLKHLQLMAQRQYLEM